MPQASIFRWQTGTGWLILSGGGDFQQEETLDIDTAVLSRTVSQKPLAYLWTAGSADRADRYLSYLDDLGGRTRFLVDAASESEDDLYEQLKEAGIIVLGEGAQPGRLHEFLRGPVLQGMVEAFQDGATLFGQGEAAALLGAWLSASDGLLTPGLGWMRDAIIVPGYTQDRDEQIKGWLSTQLPHGYSLGLGRGSAIALGPAGEVELLGRQQITVLLGKDLKSP